jgi:DNA-binding SARP family transcriptional activator
MLATFLGSTAQPFLTEYRICTLNSDGHIVDVRIIRAAQDSVAIIEVGRHSGQALELWTGARLVKEFPVRSAF